MEHCSYRELWGSLCMKSTPGPFLLERKPCGSLTLFGSPESQPCLGPTCTLSALLTMPVLTQPLARDCPASHNSPSLPWQSCLSMFCHPGLCTHPAGLIWCRFSRGFRLLWVLMSGKPCLGLAGAGCYRALLCHGSDADSAFPSCVLGNTALQSAL